MLGPRWRLGRDRACRGFAKPASPPPSVFIACRGARSGESGPQQWTEITDEESRDHPESAEPQPGKWPAPTPTPLAERRIYPGEGRELVLVEDE